MTDSKLAMWRAAIALTHLDGHASNSELNLIHDYWGAFDFSEEQEKILDADIRVPQSFNAIYPQITDARDRAHLLNFALVLFHVDGDYSHVEETLYEEFRKRHLDGLDLGKIASDTRAHVMSCANRLREETKKEKATMSWIERAFYSLTIAWNEE